MSCQHHDRPIYRSRHFGEDCGYVWIIGLTRTPRFSVFLPHSSYSTSIFQTPQLLRGFRKQRQSCRRCDRCRKEFNLRAFTEWTMFRKHATNITKIYCCHQHIGRIGSLFRGEGGGGRRKNKEINGSMNLLVFAPFLLCSFLPLSFSLSMYLPSEP